MNRIGTISLVAIGFAALHANALEVQQSPYDKIAERNLFQLRPPVIVIVDTAPKPAPLRKITLTGITRIVGRPAAFITIEGIKSQPAESIMLTEGQSVNGIEVKSIDEKAGVVKVVNGEESQILNFELPNSSGVQPNQSLIVPPTSTAPVQAKAEAVMTPEEQTALIELQRIKFQMEGNPIRAILPPTELTPKDPASP